MKKKAATDEELVELAAKLVKQGFTTGGAVRKVFGGRHIYDPPRFGHICHEVESKISTKKGGDKKPPHWYQTGQYA